MEVNQDKKERKILSAASRKQSKTVTILLTENIDTECGQLPRSPMPVGSHCKYFVLFSFASELLFFASCNDFSSTRLLRGHLDSNAGGLQEQDCPHPILPPDGMSSSSTRLWYLKQTACVQRKKRAQWEALTALQEDPAPKPGGLQLPIIPGNPTPSSGPFR